MLNLGRGQEEEKREEMRIAVNDKCDMIGYILKEKKTVKVEWHRIIKPSPCSWEAGIFHTLKKKLKHHVECIGGSGKDRKTNIQELFLNSNITESKYLALKFCWDVIKYQCETIHLVLNFFLLYYKTKKTLLMVLKRIVENMLKTNFI